MYILVYIMYTHVYSLVGSLVPESFWGSGWLILLFFLWGCSPLQLPQSLPNFFIGSPRLSLMVGCEHLPLYMSGSGRASQETAISGFCQHALLGIHNSICVWWLYMGWIATFLFFFQAEDGIRDVERSRGLGDVYKRQIKCRHYCGCQEVHADRSLI